MRSSIVLIYEDTLVIEHFRTFIYRMWSLSNLTINMSANSMSAFAILTLYTFWPYNPNKLIATTISYTKQILYGLFPFYFRTLRSKWLKTIHFTSSAIVLFENSSFLLRLSSLLKRDANKHLSHFSTVFIMLICNIWSNFLVPVSSIQNHFNQFWFCHHQRLQHYQKFSFDQNSYFSKVGD